MKARMGWALGLLVAVACTCQAGFFDAFNYPDGGLVANSGGLWQFWPGWTVDALVSGRVVNITDNVAQPDVVRYTNNLFTGAGTGLFGFDFWATGGGDAFPQVNLQASTWAYNDGGILVFITEPGDGSTIGVYDGVAVAITTSYTADTWHSFAATIVQNSGILNWTVSLDGVPFGSFSTTLTAPQGLDAVEMGTWSNNPDRGTVLVDNVYYIMPEPGTLTLLALGGLGLLRRRGRARRAG